MDHLDQAPEPQPPQRWAERLVVLEAADEALDGMPAVLWQADGAGLVIAGHTHGGQLCVPFMGALVTNCDLDRKRARGVSRWWPGAGGAPSSAAPADAAYLAVTAGLGTSPMAPVRFACRPEATLLTLLPRAE